MPAEDFHMARKVADLERRIARLEEAHEAQRITQRRLMAFAAAIRALLDEWLYELAGNSKRRDQ